MTQNFAIYPSLVDKVVFITGGASGIGAETVRAFNAQGARVGFVDLDKDSSERLVSELDGAVAFEICDLRDIEQLRAAFERLQSKLGPATVLVNNAARDDRHDWHKVTPEFWDERQATNLRHSFLLFRPSLQA